MSNSRINDFGNGYVEEIVAPTIGLDWNPETNAGVARFGMECMATLNGEPRMRTPAGVLTHHIDPANPMTCQVPVVDLLGAPVLDEGGAPTFKTESSMQVMVSLKAWFDHLHNQQAANEVPAE